MPDPLLPVADRRAHAKADEDKLSQGLARLVAEDPTLRLENNPETHQLRAVVAWARRTSTSLLDRLRNRYGVAVDSVPLRVSLRETFAGPAKGHGRHVKQSGGHGQFAVCDIEVEPLPHGCGFEFVDKVVGGSVPRQFIPSVEKGVRAQMERGRRRRLPGRRHPGDPASTARRTRSTPPTWPSRRPGRWRCGGGAAGAVDAARAGRRGHRAGRRRVRRGGHERPVRPARSRRRHRAGRRRPHPGPRRGAGGRDHPLRRRPALALARHRRRSPARTSATSRCRRTWPRRSSRVRRRRRGPLGQSGSGTALRRRESRRGPRCCLQPR